MSGDAGTGFLGRFKPDYDGMFVEEWPAYLGGIMVVLVILGLMVSGLFWGVFGGLKLWGDWFNNKRLLEPIGNVPPAEAEKRYYVTLDETPVAA